MALFATQLQPWEEHQSPSPTEESENPYELALARSRSSSKKGQKDSKAASPINTLHRQLSAESDGPPPAWKRRPSANNGANGRPPSVNGPPSASRRHPGLQMTLSDQRQPLPDAGPLNESPNASGTDLADLGLPKPAFRRGSHASSGRSSNRSSTHSLSGLTSEELWQLDQPDLSNPMRPSAETPLATARRNSRIGRSPSSQGYISPEVIWPAATPEAMSPVLKSKSTTSVASANKKRITIRKKSSRNQVHESPSTDGVYLHGTTVSPTSLSRPDSMILSSAQSSTTSLNSQGFSPVKVTPTIVANRPPSTYYSRDFLSSLAPREGGYAIAATMGNGLGAHGTMSVDERRRSHYDPTVRRAPVSKSAGMGRWSLDGGEHYGARPYGTSSAATTASNLSGPALTSPETSPPLEDLRLPEGASPAATASTMGQNTSQQSDATSPTTSAPLTIPVNPSPLSQQTHASDVATPKSERGPPVPAATQSAPALTNANNNTLSAKKSKKDLAKEAKADAQRQKLEAQQAELKRKAEAKAAAAKAKADKKEAEAKAKQEAKRKEKEEKEKRKAEKAAKKAGKSGSIASLPLGASRDKKESVPPVPPIPAAHAGAASTSNGGPTPFPLTNSSPNAPKAAAQPRQTAVSLPLDKSIPAPAPRVARPVPSRPPPALKNQKSRTSLFGTLKKRFSSCPSSTQPDVRLAQGGNAANATSGPAKPFISDFAPAPPAPSSVTAAGPPVIHTSAPSPPPGGAEAIPPAAQSPVVAIPSSPPPSQQATPTKGSASIRSGRSNSVRGPRPMPAGSASPDRHNHSRPTSLITTPSTEAAPVTPAAGFPFRNSQVNPEIVTPSTLTAETESSMFSHSTAPEQSDTSSPFTSLGSRKSSLTGDEKPLPPLAAAVDTPERGDSATSKSSEETIPAHQPQAASAPMVI